MDSFFAADEIKGELWRLLALKHREEFCLGRFFWLFLFNSLQMLTSNYFWEKDLASSWFSKPAEMFSVAFYHILCD